MRKDFTLSLILLIAIVFFGGVYLGMKLPTREGDNLSGKIRDTLTAYRMEQAKNDMRMYEIRLVLESDKCNDGGSCNINSSLLDEAVQLEKSNEKIDLQVATLIQTGNL